MSLLFEACQDQHHFQSIPVNKHLFRSKSRKLKTENLKKELKSVSLETNEYENRDESRSSDYKIFWQFQFHDFNAGSEMIVLLHKYPPEVENFRLRTLME